jgi:hypothetical protein
MPTIAGVSKMVHHILRDRLEASIMFRLDFEWLMQKYEARSSSRLVSAATVPFGLLQFPSLLVLTP